MPSTSHGDVDGAEGVLVGAAVGQRAGQEDHPRAGAEGRHAGGELLAEWLEQPRGVEEHRDGGGLPARQHDPVHPGEVLAAAHGARRHPEISEGGGVLPDIALQGEDADAHLGAPRG
jgi:hypothetical protein